MSTQTQTQTPTTATPWTVDPTHSGVSFTVRHMVFSKVRGRFARYEAALHLDETDLTRSSVEVTIEAASIDTGVADRDTHLRSADFFDVEKFPALRFRSTKVEKLGQDRYAVTGALTVRTVTRRVVPKVAEGGRGTDHRGHQRAGFTASTSFDRKDFGLKWNQLLEAGGVLVGERVDIEIELQAVRAAAQKAA